MACMQLRLPHLKGRYKPNVDHSGSAPVHPMLNGPPRLLWKLAGWILSLLNSKSPNLPYCFVCLQVITPMRKVAAGTNHLNAVLQSRLNSLSPRGGPSQKSALPTISSVAGTSGATAGEQVVFDLLAYRLQRWHVLLWQHPLPAV